MRGRRNSGSRSTSFPHPHRGRTVSRSCSGEGHPAREIPVVRKTSPGDSPPSSIRSTSSGVHSAGPNRPRASYGHALQERNTREAAQYQRWLTRDAVGEVPCQRKIAAERNGLAEKNRRQTTDFTAIGSRRAPALAWRHTAPAGCREPSALQFRRGLERTGMASGNRSGSRASCEHHPHWLSPGAWVSWPANHRLAPCRSAV
jgi:hypothetical protein